MTDATIEIRRVRSPADIGVVRDMVWEFFDFMRARYPDMLETIDAYIEDQNLAGQLADFERYFTPPAGECFLALLDGQPVGICKLRPGQDGAAELNRMYVRDAARGRGLGRALCIATIEEAWALGYRTVLLDALYRHVEALPLYRALGFRDYTAEDVFGGDDGRIVHMRLDRPGKES
ncbi:MAG: GNAT family N-acetyltransferase [Rhodobacteraceae bacterium]|nr:GNAT family N-acetyltransferase [Paracoccaceae bacterium]